MSLENLIPEVCAIAQHAAGAILEVYEGEFAVEHKDDRSPLTAADMAAHRCIVDGLQKLTPELPILSEDSLKKSRQIWCSSDRAKAWNDWMVDGKTPVGKEDCDTSAVDKNREFASKLKITGTPTIFFADGERVPGAMPLDRIEQKLGAAK